MSIVYLIGAGPGDPGLLTIKAKDVLESCDVLIYDYLANPSFVGLTKPECERIYVGKKGGDHTLPQGEINALIVRKAKEGKSVARLKGGDPYVFGRGGEEAQELRAAGVDFEVVPGVTAGVAAAAYAGIPVTHRDFTPSVAFITGHEDPNKTESLHHWEAYAKSTSTLVFYMGVKNLPMIAEKLMAGGRPADEPCALVRWGTTCEHKSFVSTLGEVAEECKRRGFTAPSIIIVGGVCSLKDELDWFESRPLLGKGVVVTRAREQASGFRRLLDDMGACTIEFPTIKINPLADYAPVDKAIGEVAEYDWLVFTSVNGVKHFWNRLAALKLDARVLSGRLVAAIGPATADILRVKGIEPDFVPEKYVAESVVEGMTALGVSGKKILVPRAKVAREVLPEKLSEAGAQVDILPVYETVPDDGEKDEFLKRLEEGRVHCVTFTSSSTVENFFALVEPELIKRHHPAVKLACIGPVTAETLANFGFTADIEPEEYTIPSLAEALVRELT